MKQIMDAQPKNALVTGASSGIGLAAALELARTGFRVIGVGREERRCQAAVRKIRAAVPGARLDFLTANLARQGEVRRLAQDVQSMLTAEGINGLDVLVNNAGTYSDSYVETEDGVEITLAVNHMAPFLLTHELLPRLQASGGGRVVTVSSESHRRTWIDPRRLNRPLGFYNGLWAYKQSKLANLLFTLEFNRRMAGASVCAFAVDPGLVNTEIGLKGTSGLSRWVWRQRQRRGVPPEVPAATIAFLCTQPGVWGTADVYWRELKPQTASRQAQDAHTACRLWEASCQICAITM